MCDLAKGATQVPIDVTPQHLIFWGSEAKNWSQLPRLVSSLINATSTPLRPVHIPEGTQTNLPGVDGLSKTSSTNPFVPDGDGAWEISTNANLKGNVRDNLLKRGGVPIELGGLPVTFTYVTTVVWTGDPVSLQNFEKDLLKEFPMWKDIRIIDATLLANWIRMAPGPAVWLAPQINLPSKGYLTIGQAWERFSNDYGVTLEEYLKVIDVQFLDEIRTWLTGDQGAHRVPVSKSDATMRIVAAVLDVINKTPRLEQLRHKMLLIEDPSTWEWLTICTTPTHLIAACGTDKGWGNAVNKGHRVIVLL